LSDDFLHINHVLAKLTARHARVLKASMHRFGTAASIR
jgi:hypothetical protein